MPKSKPKHTELPYIKKSDGQDIEILAHEGKIRVAFICRSGQGLTGENEETAAFLVRAANNHYRLIEAAKDGQETVHENHCSMLCVDTCVAMQTAIREAEKED